MLRQEDDTVMDYNEWKKKLRREKIKRSIKNTMNNVGNFCKDNAYILIPVAIGASVKVGKDIYRDHRSNKELNEKRCRFYDRRVNDYCWSTRPLSASERVEFNERYYGKKGVLKSEILRSMGLLKY